ncbi:hypothetical protein [Mesorhizobium caraganae]|uniref:hypothetical protein n=1 Tax=Mesorhizobium caraganae TaxID=483206 RepID=UPI0033361D08
MSKKAKQSREEPIDSEWVVEADYYARRCGPTHDEALKLIKDAIPPKPVAHVAGKGKDR